MSFSTDVKQELSKINNLANKELVKAELIGYLLTANIDVIGKKIKFSTESEYNINRFAKLLNNVAVQDYKIEIQGKTFAITANKFEFCEIENVNNYYKICDNISDFINAESLQKAIVRGTFLGGGSANNPEKKYHLEINLSCAKSAKYINEILKEYGIEVKTLEKESGVSLYIKDGEEISKLFAFIGANSAVLKFEEVRVLRDMRNNVNRLVNCETANLNKTIDAALKQIEDIKYIKSKNKFNELKEGLQEIAELRLKNPDATLAELGRMLKNPVGKSGVNHRLQAISKMAEELK